MTADAAPSVRVLPHVPIPMPDGAVLSATLYLPHAGALADGIRRPVVFDSYPYRKDDLMAGRTRAHRAFAARGMVAARLDVRGTGSSTGIATDEYSRQELDDTVEAIAWFAAQPWSNGNVGMFGSSYGGFNAIQVAMRRPPALKAICPMYFTDNRYTDDCHYRGGSLQMLYDVGAYGLSMVALNALPPARAAVGEGFEAVWADHLRAEPWLLTWLEHQTLDDYWRHGSLDQDYGALECATYLFGGWRDGYVTSNLRTFEGLRAPKKLLLGPWTHTWPDAGVPGPQIDHLHEQARFFEHWLLGVENGVMDEPPITIYVQAFDAPKGRREHTSGFWRHEAGWPLDRSTDRCWRLIAAGGLALDGGVREPAAAIPYRYDPTVGTTFGIFAGSSGLPLIPSDQREEAGRSIAWTSDPLAEPIEILGRPRFDARVSVSAPIATLVVRLIDVAPDGAAAQLTKGHLNLTHRWSHETPQPMTPGVAEDVRIELEATSWIFAPGHRVAVAVTASDYPMVWPSPLPHEGAIHVGGDAPTALTLPVLGAQDPPLPPPVLRPPSAYEELPSTTLARPSMRVTRDHATGAVEVRIGGASITHLGAGATAHTRSEATTRVAPDDPAHASIRGTNVVELHSPEHTVVATATGSIESDETSLQAGIDLAVTLDGALFHARSWRRTYPRRLL